MKNLKSVVAVLMVAATVIGTAATRKTTTIITLNHLQLE